MSMFPRSFRKFAFMICMALTVSAIRLPAQSILTADGQTDAYTRIKNVLASSPETPDCSHPDFGPHITQTIDDNSNFNKYVFVFNIHVTPDNDRCIAFDRQRLEIKTEGNSSTPDYLKGFLGDSVTFRWNFKLPDGFQPSTAFTHIHQIKAYDGDASNPIITLTPRKASPNRLELILVDSHGVTTKLATTPLAPLIGKWVEAYEKITYGHDGQYSIVLKSVDDGSTLFTYSNGDLDLWRTGTTVVRPKWGIYRSLNDSVDLRDEQVRFDRFCLAKGTDDCVSDQDSPEFSLAATPPSGPVGAGGTASIPINATALRSFSGDITLSVTGLPAGATAQFSPAVISGGAGSATLNVTTLPGTTPGTYSLIVEGVSGVLSHVVTVPLDVETDSTPPATSASLLPVPNLNGWNNSDVAVALNSSDDGTPSTGVKQITFSATGAQPMGSTNVAGSSTSFVINTEGTTTITFFATDNAGNVEAAKTTVVNLDKTSPAIAGMASPVPNSNGWNNSSVTVAFSCNDTLSGLAGGTPAPVVLSAEGVNQSVTGMCTDLAGNPASATVGGINIDLTPPTVTCAASPSTLWPPNNHLVPVDVAVNVSDSLSGTASFSLVSVTSNEPDSGDGDIQGFVPGTASTSGYLRAQRLGSGTGRIYTFVYQGFDAAGNSSQCTTNVTVPHDQGN